MTLSKLAGACALALIVAATAATEAHARKRKTESRELVLLQRLLIQNAKLERELVAIQRQLRRDEPLVVSLPVPPVNRNRLAIVPVPILDITAVKGATLDGYRNKIAIESIGRIPTKGLGKVKGLNAQFLAKLAALRRDMPSGTGFSVISGYRTWAQQAALYRQKPGLAARPGRSNHQRGLAGDLKFSSRESSRWVHRNAHKYALRFPMSYEPWHIEPVGASRTRYAMKRQRHAALR